MGAAVSQVRAEGLPALQKPVNLYKFLRQVLPLTTNRSFYCYDFSGYIVVARVFTFRLYILFAPVHVAKILGWLEVALLAAVCGLAELLWALG